MTVRAPAPTPITAHRGGKLTGRLHVTGDLGLSHLAAMLGGLSTGLTRISGLARSDGVLRTLAGVEALGSLVRREGARVDVYGRGVGGLRQPLGPLDCGGSSMAVHLTLGAIAGHDLTVEVIGGAALAGQSLQPVLVPLRQMGLGVAGDRSNLPLVVRGSGSLVPVVHRMDVASEPIKHAVLLAGLAATGETTVIEPAGSGGLGWRLMRHLGADVRFEQGGAHQSTTVAGDAELEGRDIAIPGDAVLAAVLAGAAALVPNSSVTLDAVPCDPTSPGLFPALAEFGADVTWHGAREESGIPIGDVRIQHRLMRGMVVSRERVREMATELPLLVAVATFASGETRFEGIDQLAEVDRQRLAVVAAGLGACGVPSRIDGGGLIVHGVAAAAGGVEIADVRDPLVAIALLLVGLRSERPVTIDDGGSIGRRFPEFRSLLGGLGARLDG